jgi:hypothetical protein
MGVKPNCEKKEKIMQHCSDNGAGGKVSKKGRGSEIFSYHSHLS